MTQSTVALGIMTGNSMDAVDCVISSFSTDGDIRDLSFHSKDFPSDLAADIRTFRSSLKAVDGDISQAEKKLQPSLDDIHERYITLVTAAAEELIDNALQSRIISDRRDIEIVGFHGQTCAHKPPSVTKGAGSKPYTIQLGNGQELADRLNLRVASDFRADDVMNGGEGAPLAPMHHKHLADKLRSQGIFPVAFVNGGNTANITLISENLKTHEEVLLGFDSGPCNHLPDLLCRTEKNISHDHNGTISGKGKISLALLRNLFEHAVVTEKGINFLLVPPPRSSDPQWYHPTPELLGSLPTDGVFLPFEDRLRTSLYFSAYCLVWSLSLLPGDIQLPQKFLLSGGGWKNPTTKAHLQGLLAGDFLDNPVLPEHLAAFKALGKRFDGFKAEAKNSQDYGWDSDAMEARLFADAAVCCLRSIPFTLPSVTGVKAPCVCGIIVSPHSKTLIKKIDPRFGRAVPGW